MPDDLKVRDNRKGYYWIDNEVYENYELSMVALAIYNDMACRANNSTQKAYFAANAFCRRFSVGKKTTQDAFRELISNGLVRVTGKNERGCKTIELVQVKKGGSSENQQKTEVLNKNGVVSQETASGSQENTNNTDKQDGKQNVRREILEEYNKAFNTRFSDFDFGHMFNAAVHSSDLETVEFAMRAAIEARNDSEVENKFIPRLSNLLGSPGKLQDWASKWREKEKKTEEKYMMMGGQKYERHATVGWVNCETGEAL